MSRRLPLSSFFFFNDTATTEIYTLSLHDALPIFWQTIEGLHEVTAGGAYGFLIEDPKDSLVTVANGVLRSEEHTSELQSRSDLVCRLLLEKKKKHASYIRSP